MKVAIIESRQVWVRLSTASHLLSTASARERGMGDAAKRRVRVGNPEQPVESRDTFAISSSRPSLRY
jgi:hypothetical protein